jgi:alkyl hydroperoxide reductase subunit AhpC
LRIDDHLQEAASTKQQATSQKLRQIFVIDDHLQIRWRVIKHRVIKASAIG